MENKDIIKIFDKLDLDKIGLISHEDFLEKMFKEKYQKKEKYQEDNEIIIAFRRRPDLLEIVTNQLKEVESRSK